MGEMEMMNNDDDCWSLLAVVKECTRKTKARDLETNGGALNTTTPTPAIVENSYNSQQPFPSQFEPRSDNSFCSLPLAAATTFAAGESITCLSDELTNMYSPFLLPSAGATVEPDSISTNTVHETNDMLPTNLPVLRKADRYLQPPNQELLQPRDFQKKLLGCPVGHCMYKKKKFEDKRVCRFSLDELSSNDKWAWRKYGQKPIKGSPYPRNYYRCSSIKGCSARKQVERCPIDPETYVVTYTGRHYHPYPPVRNSGGPRAKITGSDPDHPLELESPTSIVNHMGADQTGSGSITGSGSGENIVKFRDDEQDDEEEDDAGGGGEEGNNYEILIPNSMAGTDMLMGMDQLVGKVGNSCSGSASSSSTITNNVDGYGRNSGGSDPCVHMVNGGNGYGYGLGIRETDASPAASFAAAHEMPNNRGLNIWDNGMIY